MMERVDEMTSPPIIGKRYWVQCAFVPPKSATADKRGVVTCAGHGLQWNQKTGVLVREGQVVL